MFILALVAFPKEALCNAPLIVIWSVISIVTNIQDCLSARYHSTWSLHRSVSRLRNLQGIIMREPAQDEALSIIKY